MIVIRIFGKDWGMSEPKFHRFQKVGVTALTPTLVVIPQTLVIDIRYVEAGEPGAHPETREIRPMARSGYWYLVIGLNHWVAERCLRPLDDDDYKKEKQQELILES